MNVNYQGLFGASRVPAKMNTRRGTGADVMLKKRKAILKLFNMKVADGTAASNVNNVPAYLVPYSKGTWLTYPNGEVVNVPMLGLTQSQVAERLDKVREAIENGALDEHIKHVMEVEQERSANRRNKAAENKAKKVA